MWKVKERNEATKGKWWARKTRSKKKRKDYSQERKAKLRSCLQWTREKWKKRGEEDKAQKQASGSLRNRKVEIRGSVILANTSRILWPFWLTVETLCSKVEWPLNSLSPPRLSISASNVGRAVRFLFHGWQQFFAYSESRQLLYNRNPLASVGLAQSLSAVILPPLFFFI